jgi:hypothetical protein
MKYSKMSRLVLLSVVAVAAAALAYAQSQPHNMSADIPFDFNAGTTQLAAGHYMVTSLSPATVTLRSDSGQSVTITTHSAETLNPTVPARLVFHRYGDVYFLSQLWGPGQDIGRELPRSAAEKEAAKGNVRMLAMIRLK